MQVTELRLPFDGKWLVFWGGDTKDLNVHHENPTQKHALDFVIADQSGKTHQGEGLKNEDYFCFGQAILAPAAGEVVEAVDGVRDNMPGDTNPYSLPGNYILIKHSDNEFSFIAHLLKNSVSVKIGDLVKLGQRLAKCGNSGNSSEPHLHYHLQDSFIFARFNKNHEREYVAKGIKVHFSSIILNKNGQKAHPQEYSPIKNDIVEAV